MDLVQTASNPWGQEIVVRAAWGLLWVVVIAAGAFVVLHFALRFQWVGKGAHSSTEPLEGSAQVKRHSLAARLFHWVMAGSMFVLLFTGFLPILGFHFSWVTAHWVAGLVLIGTIVFHLIHVLVRRSLLEMWVGPRDIKNWFLAVARGVGVKGAVPSRSSKYPVDNKLFHHAIVVVSIAVIVTGVIMMMLIETPLFTPNPELLSDENRGLVFVVHGLASIALVGLVIAHLYFAILPEKRWITRAMFTGLIPRREYMEHHDPERWAAEPEPDEGAPTSPPVSPVPATEKS